MKVKLFTNTQKSQFRNVREGYWQIVGIPMTVDDEVMNGIMYTKDDNLKGLNSYRGQPVTLRHPEDENGNPVSALSGTGLIDHFSGGTIVNTYNHNGVNYADAEFKESMMLAQDNGEYYLNKLKSGESIGISTGLYFDGNNESGTSASGKEYHAVARNQVGDHVAMLPDDEPPAGGDATFIRFNGDNDDQVLSINIDEVLLQLNASAEVVMSKADVSEEDWGLFTRLLATCKRVFATDSDSCDNVNANTDLLTNENEGDAMRDTLIATLTAKGITVNAEISDAELLAKYNEANTPDATEAMNAVVAPLKKQIESLSSELASNADKELDGLASQAAPLMGLDEAEAKTLGANALHKVLAKNGVVVGTPNGVNHKSPEGNEAGLTKFWEAK